MGTPHGIKLAIYLVSSHLGDLNAKVCECLLRRGTLTLAQIIRFTELSRENVRRSLLVLIHQNCIQAFAVEQDGGFGQPRRITTHYAAVFDNIIHRLRFPKFIEIVSKELGKECEGIIEGLLQHGRLSINQIIDRQKHTLNKGNFDKGTIQENFSKLVNARFVERCPAPEPLVLPPSDEETKAAKKAAKSSKSAKSDKSDTVTVDSKPQTMEHRALVAAAPIKSLRFFVDMDELSDASDKISDDQVTRSTLREKRKRDFLESDGGLLSHEEKKEVLWRANFEEFVRRLRNKMCVAFVTSRLNKEAGIVLNAVLELIGQSEMEMSSGSTDSLTVEGDIYDEVMKNEAAVGMDKESVEEILDRLESQMLLTHEVENWKANLKNIIRAAQMEEVESIVLKRFGRESYRIFRLLSKAGRLLESEKIASETFVEKKDAMKILYTLWKGDYIQMEKVNISHGGRVLLFTLWKVNDYSLREQVLDEMYHAALNLRLRIAHEVDQEKELLRIPKEKIVGDMEKRHKRLVKLRIILESSFMDLDDALMLFGFQTAKPLVIDTD